MSDEKNPLEDAVEQALDLFVYAPIGLLFEGPALLPTLVEKGRNQVSTARFIGQFAVEQGQTEARKQVAKLQEQAAGIVGLLGGLGSRDDRRPAPAPASRLDATAPEPMTAARPSSGDSSGLAIPDYDSLSASQVVNRLAGLDGPDLEAVRAYEAAHRGRKTILNKVAQLQG